MVKSRPLFSLLGALSLSATILQAQVPATPQPAIIPNPSSYVRPAPIDPVLEGTSTPQSIVPPVAHPSVPATAAPVLMESAAPAPATTNVSKAHDFQGDDVGLVLRSLARQAGINISVSDKIVGTVNMRLENMTPREAIDVIVTSRGLFVDEQRGVLFVKTAEERAKEPAEPNSYQFSYASAEKMQALLDKQLASGAPSQFDPRTNTIYYRETRTNMDKIRLFLESVDHPTEQVMIEARLVEVTANPQQNFDINWAGVVGGSTPQTVRYGGSTLGGSKLTDVPAALPGALPTQITQVGTLPTVLTNTQTGQLTPQDLLFGGAGSGNFLQALQGQFAILSVPQMSATLRLLNEDQDTEFLANPRVVTANNQKAEIKITRAQPVPQLNFNEQTAQAVFSGFQDKEFGNTLVVQPAINKDGFISMNVKPEISNKVADASFTFSGSTVVSPIIDKRSLESNVLIKSGDTLAIGGLLQDEMRKGRTKVPILGDIPGLGYLFQEKSNARVKRNLLVFVTPTVIKQGYGTGLEDQVTGVKHSGDEYADPNGWRNNAKGAVRLVPTSNRQVAADYPKPGVAPAAKKRAAATTTKTTKVSVSRDE